MDLRRRIVVEIDGRQTPTGAQQVTSELRKIDQGSRQASSSLNMLKTTANSALAVLGVGSVSAFAKMVLDAGLAVDRLNRSFTAITGSQWGAAREMDFLRDTANRLGMSFYDLAPAYKQIAAASRDTVLEGEQVRDVFSAVTEAGSALGMTSADMEGSLRALAQMISKGTVQAEELRGQLGERLPGAFQISARALGVTTQGLGKMLEQGQVLATDLLPKLADELHRMYGEAAQTAALESGQAAVNRLSDSWEGFKASLYYNEPAVAGINAIAAALRELADEANSLSRIRDDMFAIGETMSSPAFLSAGREQRLLMLNMGGESTYRGKVNRGDVRTSKPPVGGGGLPPETGTSAESLRAFDKIRNDIAKLTMDEFGYARFATETEYDKLAKALGKATPELERWLGLKKEEIRLNELSKLDPYQVTQLEAMNRSDSFFGKADADQRGLDMLNELYQRNDQLLVDFTEKHRAVVIGETAFKLEQLETQADAFRRAGADELALEQWLQAEREKASREWQDGARLGLAEYANNATNAAMLAHDAIVGGFQGMEDALVSFVTTGKLEFSDLANSIISDLARIAIQQTVTAPLANLAGGLISSLVGGMFGGGVSAAAGFGIAGELSSFMSLNAKGNVFESPGLHAYANSIVDSPTVFPFARGVGLMGEAGPEAIMPLKRGADGTLGVAGGGGANIVINQIEAPGRGGEVQQRQENGVNVIDLFVERIESRIAGGISQGRGLVPQAIQRTYGLSRAPGAY